jgi:isochorismate synthase
MMKYKGDSAVLEKQLLDEYEVGDFFLASPYRTLLGKGSFITVPRDEENANQMDGLSARVAAALKKAKEQGYDNPVVTGAVPFDNKKDAQLIVPENIRSSAPLRDNDTSFSMETKKPTYEMQSVPDPFLYKKGVERGLTYIKSGHLDKIVLSRTLHLTSSETVNINPLLHNLAQHNKNGYTFAVDLPQKVEGKADTPFSKTLIGASPELLVSRSGLQVMANPLAGSRPRSDDPIEDKRRADELLASAKDLHEHAVVVHAVAEALGPFFKTMDVPEKPTVIHTETMWHLSTEVKGELNDPATSSLELAIALHPTPAVCGSPTDLAREAIQEIEPFDRGFFTGMVGWCDAEGDGEWVVTIRCAEVERQVLRLFAGAGVVAESKPEEELLETSAKFQTMLRAMGIDAKSLN